MNQDNAPKQKKLSWQQSWLLYLHDVVYLLAVIVIVLLLLFRVVVVSGSSMYHTLLDGDMLLLLSNTFYTNPKQGDIVVLSTDSYDSGAPIVKRIIATEGQTVDIDFAAGTVCVDGQVLDEPYTYTATNTQGGTHFPLIVDEGCVFVMGDNRNSSRDSRYPDIGLIDEREILGKAFFLMLPGGGEYGTETDYSRIGVLQ